MAHSAGMSENLKVQDVCQIMVHHKLQELLSVLITSLRQM